MGEDRTEAFSSVFRYGALLAVELLPRATGYPTCHTLNSGSVACPLS